MLRFSAGLRLGFTVIGRAALAGLGLVSILSVGACTTTEGTNAMTDFGTFEREVMTSTLVGFGMVPREEKEETTQRRARLALPKDGAPLPLPTDEKMEVAEIPVDSANVQIDMTGLTDADLKRLRNARVVDLHTLSGRPLTDTEAKQLTARMKAAMISTGPRPLYMPPEDYFVAIDGKQMVCKTKSGEIVSLRDPKCPYEIKAAIGKSQPENPGLLGSMMGN